MSIRVRIKSGHLEVDYEGSETFLVEELPDVIRSVVKASGSVAPPTNNGAAGANHSGNAEGDNGESGGELELSENNVAAKLNSTEGGDLVTAAAAHLRLVQGKSTFTRDELRSTMKNATDYWTQNKHGKNLSYYIKGLVSSGKLIERSKDVFALPASEASSLKSQLAES
jgi:hypothetical protein